MTAQLTVSPEMKLPAEAVTQTFGIVAKRGVGKTNTSVVITEEMLRAGHQVVVADPVGVWWGLRAAANGQDPGLPIIVMGGDHGDVPLEIAAGSLIADFIVDSRQSVVLDLAHFRKGEQVRFMTDFCERLYHRNREPLHLVLDEADAFAPQKPFKGQERMLGAVEDLVRRGRARGIGVTLITQRSAVINKNVLSQVEVLVAMRTIGPQDRAAIEAWIEVHGTEEQKAELLASLPSLPIGTAWFWSPGWLDIFKKIQVRKRDTFDSSATPKVGERPRAPKKMAAVDLEQLKVRIAATIEKQKAEDPRALRAEIQRLTGELKKALRTTQQPVARETKRVEVQVLKDAHVKALERVAVNLDRSIERLVDSVADIQGAGGVLRTATQPVADAVRRLQAAPAAAQRDVAPVAHERPALPRTGRSARPAGKDPRDRILRSLAWWRAANIEQPTREQVAFVAGYTVNGHFNNTLSNMRTEGVLDYPAGNLVELSPAGAREAGPVDAVPTRDDLINRVRAVLRGEPARRIFDVIVSASSPLTREEAAEGAGYTVNGHFNNELGGLRALGIVDYPRGGTVALSRIFEALERREA